MGIKFHKKKKEKIKDTGDDFILEQYEIYDDLTLNRQASTIKYDPKIMVSQIKSNPLEEYKIIII